MLEICTDKDQALIDLVQERGLLDAATIERVHTAKGARSLAVTLVEDGHLDAGVVRALRTDVRRRSVDHAVNGYQLMGRLGAGGMSEVFKATDVVNRKLVAFKVISPRVFGDGLFLERFHREARSAMAVVHPNVIACHGIGETKGKAYMVLEYMPGGDLEALVKREGGRLSEASTLRIAMDCARGLEAIHAHGLVHRDIKPSNILLDADGLAKIADLGLAKSAAPDDQLTMPGKRVGSPGYISPEQAGGQQDLDIRSDIYSLGATLYYLLSGKCPFTGRTPIEMIMKCMREDPTPLREIAPAVSEPVAALVARCMSRRSDDRFADPTALLQALKTMQTMHDPVGSTVGQGSSAATRSAICVRRQRRLHRSLASIGAGVAAGWRWLIGRRERNPG